MRKMTSHAPGFFDVQSLKADDDGFFNSDFDTAAPMPGLTICFYFKTCEKNLKYIVDAP